MERFIFAKIHKGNRLANVYLSGQGELGRIAIPIYFDDSLDNEEQFLRQGGAAEQGRLFFECGREPEGKVVIVIHDGTAHFLRPDGPVEFTRSTVRPEIKGYVKLLPVAPIASVALVDVPPVLAGIGSNRYYSSGTFREIRTAGNVIAIRSILGLPLSLPEAPTIAHAVQCLGSVELETLVAKLFEEAGVFVPAYRGGNIQGADLFLRNKSRARAVIGRLAIEPGERKSIQIKLDSRLTQPPAGVEYLLVASGDRDTGNLLGAAWLTEALRASPVARGWLVESLDWLPPAYLSALRSALH